MLPPSDWDDIPPFLHRKKGEKPHHSASAKPLYQIIAEEKYTAAGYSRPDLRALQLEDKKRRDKARIAKLKKQHEGEVWVPAQKKWVPEWAVVRKRRKRRAKQTK